MFPIASIQLNWSNNIVFPAYTTVANSLCCQYAPPYATKPRVFMMFVLEGTLRSWFTTPVLLLECHLATTGNGAQIIDWFLGEFLPNVIFGFSIWPLILTSLIPFVYVSEERYRSSLFCIKIPLISLTCYHWISFAGMRSEPGSPHYKHICITFSIGVQTKLERAVRWAGEMADTISF